VRHFLFEEKNYQYRPNYKRKKDKRNAVEELSRLLRKGAKGHTPQTGGRKDLRQKCIAKMQYSSSIEAHRVQLEKYLSREGTDIDGSAAELFGTDSEEYRKNMAGKNFRIFLSPESGKADARELAEKFIEKLEKQTGYSLYWQGACHYNTAHPHAHLLINGVDKYGREIQFPKDVVKTFMRETARDICTRQIGNRTQKDLDREKEQELASPRFTKLDERIEKLNAGNLRILLEGAVYDKERILARLETLRKLKLCTYENGGYALKDGWQEDLKTNGRYNAFLKARGELRYTDPSLMTIYTGEQGRITGKVTKIYRTDEDASDNHAVVLEALNGRAYFIPLLKKPELHEGGKKTLLKEGELVTITTYETQRGRLTPVLIRPRIKDIQKDIRKSKYTGTLASEIIKTRSGGLGKNRTN
jgi:hypothetical protein